MPGLPEDYPHDGGDVHAFSTFNFEAHHVRVIDINGEPWFVGLDVCEALGHRNTKHALSRLDDDERATVQITDALGRPRDTTVISEAGVWRLVLTSRVEGAEAFKHYLVHEILPRWRRGKLAELPGQAPATPAPLPDTARTVQLMEDTIARALDAGVTDECLARLTAARLELALGRTPELPPLEFKPKALPAPSYQTSFAFEGAASIPRHMVTVVMAPDVLKKLRAGDEAVKRFIRAAVNDCVDHPERGMGTVH